MANHSHQTQMRASSWALPKTIQTRIRHGHVFNSPYFIKTNDDGGGGSGSDDDDERGDSESRDGDDETPAAILDAPEYEKMSVACFRKCYDSEFAPPKWIEKKDAIKMRH